MEEPRDSRFRGNDALGLPMTGDGCRAEPFTDKYRQALKAACAEDKEIWQIGATDFGPTGFDASIDRFADALVDAVREVGVCSAESS